MHMADALISPAVGGTLWAASAGLIAYCARRVRRTLRDDLVPMMGVLGAFVFAAQMINFSIPGTGSSGHLGGGLVLSILLGPHAAFLAIASILTVQALFFADGGLLALGCNIFNLGFFPAFIGYAFVYRLLAGDRPDSPRAWGAALAAAIAGLQLGSLGVVVETTLSGRSELSFGTFVLIMQPIHLAIGIVEGIVTAALVRFLVRVRPEALPPPAAADKTPALKTVAFGVLVAAAVTAGVLSWFASSHPDGLEWSLARLTGSEEFRPRETGPHRVAADLQRRTALLPDYALPSARASADAGASAPPPGRLAGNAGTSVAGLAGTAITLALIVVIGYALRRRRRMTP